MQKIPTPLRQTAFTLLEVIIITAIATVLSLIVVSTYSGYQESSRNAIAESQIRSLALVINDFVEAHGRYPNSLAEINNDTLRDPWGNPYVFVNLEANKDSDADSNAGTSISLSMDGHHHDHNISDSDSQPDSSYSMNNLIRKDGNLVPINTHFDLYSRGKNGISKAPLQAAESLDDIIYANDGGYIGMARDY